MGARDGDAGRCAFGAWGSLERLVGKQSRGSNWICVSAP